MIVNLILKKDYHQTLILMMIRRMRVRMMQRILKVERMSSYSDALNNELKATTLDKTFVHAQEQSSKKNDEGSSSVNDEMEDELTPVDVDFNLVNFFLDSYSSQEGLSSPASNLLGLMGLRLPDDVAKGK